MSDVRAERERDFDRFLTFVDAIVAIAITLLVLPLVDVAGAYQGDSATQLLSDSSHQIWAFFLSFVGDRGPVADPAPAAPPRGGLRAGGPSADAGVDPHHRVPAVPDGPGGRQHRSRGGHQDAVRRHHGDLRAGPGSAVPRDRAAPGAARLRRDSRPRARVRDVRRVRGRARRDARSSRASATGRCCCSWCRTGWSASGADVVTHGGKPRRARRWCARGSGGSRRSARSGPARRRRRAGRRGRRTRPGRSRPPARRTRRTDRR